MNSPLRATTRSTLLQREPLGGAGPNMALGRKRIALVVPSFEDCGGVITVARFVLQTIERSLRFEAKVISLATSSADPCSLLLSRPSTWLRGVTTQSGAVAGTPFTHVGASLGELEFRRYAHRRVLDALVQDCDLIQVVAGVPAWAWPVVGLGKPVALQVATLAKVEREKRLLVERFPTREWRRVMTRFTTVLDDAALRSVHAVLVENQWMLNYARAAARSDAIVRYAPPGVDTQLFHPVNGVASDAPQDRYVIAVGRFSDPRKNVILLLEAFARARRRSAPGLCLVVVDPDGPDAAFKKQVAELGLEDAVTVRVRTSNEKLAHLYRNAVCLALSSEEEGFGMVVIEAMASGIPVVATRCGGPDGIITEGYDGFLVPVGNPEALADRLTLLAGDAEFRRAMGSKARQTVEERFSTAKAGQAFLSVYDNLLHASLTV